MSGFGVELEPSAHVRHAGARLVPEVSRDVQLEELVAGPLDREVDAHVVPAVHAEDERAWATDLADLGLGLAECDAETAARTASVPEPPTGRVLPPELVARRMPATAPTNTTTAAITPITARLPPERRFARAELFVFVIARSL